MSGFTTHPHHGPHPSHSHPTHTHHSEYADPVMRVPSPASSVGTTYGPDQTSYSDSEFQLSQPAFARKCDERIGLHVPRKEELQADQDPLLTMIGPNGRPVRVNERSEFDTPEMLLLHERVMVSLRAEVAQLRENELFEQILLRGSKAALYVQPMTNDIDALMRSMMGPGMNINAGPHMGKSSPAPPPPAATASDHLNGEGEGESTATISSTTPTPTTGSGIVNGPWNNWGQPSEAETQRKYPTEHMLSATRETSGTTVGKRSRNGTARKA